MPWFYQQWTGVLFHDTDIIATGYAGRGTGLNNADAQFEHDVGPLPRGSYTIEAPIVHPHCGPYALRLDPAGTNDMRGRAGFYIHGDNPDMDHTASNGCMIFPHDVRQAIWDSGDHALQVAAGPQP